MLSALTFTSMGFSLVSPANAPLVAVRRASSAFMLSDTTMPSAEAEAKAAWLAKLDAPAWGAAAKALSVLAAEAAEIQAQIDGANANEEEAKQAWLAKLDVPSWGKAATAMEEIAAEMIAVESAPKMSEEEAKQAWLAKLDAPVWGKMTEEQAKQAWLAKLDAPVWGQAAAVMTSVVAEATKMAELTEECNAGDSTACDTLSNEEEAKKAWLAKLDVPSWGKMTEEQAKKKWLAKLDVPASWQGKVTPTAQKAAEPVLF